MAIRLRQIQAQMALLSNQLVAHGFQAGVDAGANFSGFLHTLNVEDVTATLGVF